MKQMPNAPVHMTDTEFTAIRTSAGLTKRGLTRVLRIQDDKSVWRMEQPELRADGTPNPQHRAISGPVSIIMELIDAGELPQRYWPQPDQSDEPSAGDLR